MRVSGIWDTLSGIIMDTAGHLIEANGILAQFDTLDAEMDRYQDRGYLLVGTIATESEDLRARELAQKALVQFYISEHLESMNEDNVHQGQAAVEEAQGSNGQAIGLSQQRRRRMEKPDPPREEPATREGH